MTSGCCARALANNMTFDTPFTYPGVAGNGSSFIGGAMDGDDYADDAATAWWAQSDDNNNLAPGDWTIDPAGTVAASAHFQRIGGRTYRSIRSSASSDRECTEPRRRAGGRSRWLRLRFWSWRWHCTVGSAPRRRRCHPRPGRLRRVAPALAAIPSRRHESRVASLSHDRRSFRRGHIRPRPSSTSQR